MDSGGIMHVPAFMRVVMVDTFWIAFVRPLNLRNLQGEIKVILLFFQILYPVVSALHALRSCMSLRMMYVHVCVYMCMHMYVRACMCMHVHVCG